MPSLRPLGYLLSPDRLNRPGDPLWTWYIWYLSEHAISLKAAIGSEFTRKLVGLRLKAMLSEPRRHKLGSLKSWRTATVRSSPRPRSAVGGRQMAKGQSRKSRCCKIRKPVPSATLGERFGEESPKEKHH